MAFVVRPDGGGVSDQKLLNRSPYLGYLSRPQCCLWFIMRPLWFLLHHLSDGMMDNVVLKFDHNFDSTS